MVHSHDSMAASAALGESGAAVVAVVDQDRQPPSRRMRVGRDAADVPAVAGRDQRQQADGGMLCGVRGGRSSGTSSTGRPVSGFLRAKLVTWRETRTLPNATCPVPQSAWRSVAVISTPVRSRTDVVYPGSVAVTSAIRSARSSLSTR